MRDRSILEPTFEQYKIPRDFNRYPVMVGGCEGIATNNADYVTHVRETLPNGKQKLVWECPVYTTWAGMIKRGYSQGCKEKYPTYQNVTVCEEWLLFSNFRSWWVESNVRNWQLDKDLLVQGNLIYSSEACVFIPPYLNKLLTDKAAARGDYPLGVCLDPRRVKPYRSVCWVGGKQKHLGYFPTPKEAHRVWQLFKIKAIKDAITRYTEESTNICIFDKRIVTALAGRISILQDDVDNDRETLVLH